VIRVLEIEDLSVMIGGKLVLDRINLRIAKGEVGALFGPNGSGKTTLLLAIMGSSKCKVLGGRIRYKGIDITEMPMDERARLGIGMAFQHPPSIRGVKTRNLLAMISNGMNLVDDMARELGMTELLDRDLNYGFSGGERRKSEILQLLLQRPEMILLDEPESGVDLVNIELIGKAINKLLGKEKKPDRNVSALIVTHTGHILEYVNADKGYIILDGRITCSGNPRDLLQHIRERGFRGCEECRCL
jgi:Fe-S cluster assembly ATP-binding protein